MKKFLRITAVIVLTLMLVLSFTSCGKSKVESANGTFAEGLSWAFDAETKVLTISGTGRMTDFDAPSSAPWSGVKANVQKVVITGNITSIGNYSFYCMTALESVEIAESVKNIGVSAFAFCSKIVSIPLPTGLETIGDRAFEGCSALSTVLVPANVKHIGASAFSSCRSVEVAAILSDVALPDEVFFNCINLKELFLNPGIEESEVSASAFKGCSISFANHKDKDGDTLTSVITVKFVDENGVELAESKVETCVFGANYNIVSPTVDGYTAEKLSVTGYADGNDETITVKYTKNPEVTTTVAPEQTDVPEEEEPFSTKDIIPIVVLIVLLVGIAVAAVLIIRAQKRNEGNNTTVRKNPPANGKNNKSRK